MKLFQRSLPGDTDFSVNVAARVAVVGVASGISTLVFGGAFFLLACWRPMGASLVMFTAAALLLVFFAMILPAGPGPG